MIAQIYKKLFPSKWLENIYDGMKEMFPTHKISLKYIKPAIYRRRQLGDIFLNPSDNLKQFTL